MIALAATRASLAISNLVRQKHVNRALAQYLLESDALTGRTALEWQLAEAIAAGTGAVRAPASWPRAMLVRPSGAALAFVVAQRTRTACEPPSPLFRPQVLPPRMPHILASAWAEHPYCEALHDASDRRAFARRLSSDTSALEPLLDALLHLDDAELVTEIAAKWLRHPLAVLRAPISILERMAERSELRAICLDAARMRIPGARATGDELVRLAQIFATLEEHRAVIAVSDVARGRDIAPALCERLLALRLGALAAEEAAEQLVEEYRRDWIPTGAAYPAPEQLLFPLHLDGANDAIEHLLARAPESSPRWIHGWRRMLSRKPVPAALIAEWVSLLRDDQQDGVPLLVGLSESILAASNTTRMQERETVRWVRNVWSDLLRRGEHGLLAQAYLVLLEDGDSDIVRTFERVFSGDAWSSHLARRAVVAYVRALSRLREWRKLRAFFDAAPAERLRAALGAHELEMHELMASLKDLPDGGSTSADGWLAAWERLLALPLDAHRVWDVLRHFIECSASLRAAASDVPSLERFEDVHLQVLRRGCAEAERLLVAGNLSPDEMAERRCRLLASDLAGVSEVINDLKLRVVQEGP